MTYELWHSEQGNSYTYFAKNENYMHNLSVVLEGDAVLIWRYEAKSHFDAMRAYHEHMGYEPYRPEPDWEDIVYETS